MILHMLTFALTGLMACTAAHLQQYYMLKRSLAVSRVNNPFVNSASFNVRIEQSNTISPASKLNPVRSNTIIFITSKSINKNEF